MLKIQSHANSNVVNSKKRLKYNTSLTSKHTRFSFCSCLMGKHCFSGRISYYTHPPEEKKTVHLDAKIVEQMAKEFDWVRNWLTNLAACSLKLLVVSCSLLNITCGALKTHCFSSLQRASKCVLEV